MQVEVLEPVGVRLTDVDLAVLSAADVEAVKRLLADHGVAVVPDQELDDTAFLALLKSFGELTFTVGETPVDGYPDLNVISNVGRTTPPKSTFHTDTSYVANPPIYTALRAVTIPSEGGQTLFTNQYAAWDTLPADLREKVAGRSITHQVTGLDLGPEEETSADHPAGWAHPISGRTALYLSTPARCVAVSGLEAEESREVIGELFAHSTAPENTLRHTWSAGDVVIWDNRCVLHRADHDGVVGDRVMHRGMVTVPDAA